MPKGISIYPKVCECILVTLVVDIPKEDGATWHPTIFVIGSDLQRTLQRSILFVLLINKGLSDIDKYRTKIYHNDFVVKEREG